MKKPNPYKKYYKEKRKQGWRQVVAFGPPDLVDAVKSFIKQYKKENNLYKYDK